MKNKYQRLSKAEKKHCRNLYFNTVKGKEMHIRLIRLNLIGTIGILFSFFIICNDEKNNSLNWTSWFIFGTLLFFSIVFLIASWKLRRKLYNDYAIKHL